jgi:hypothetical protein
MFKFGESGMMLRLTLLSRKTRRGLRTPKKPPGWPGMGEKSNIKSSIFRAPFKSH